MRQKLDAPKREVEFSLVIATEQQEIYRKLARLRKVRGYELVPSGSRRLVDHYFDTRDGKLRKRGFALRLRSVNGSIALALKGRARATGMGEDRLEAERPFSPSAIDEVRTRANLPMRAPVERVRGKDPALILEEALDVRVIQTRETIRLVRKVVRGVGKTNLAELALDRVHFHIRDRAVTHYEVEVESKKRGEGRRAVRELSDALQDRYPGALLPWPYGKLATGKALEQLARKSALKNLADNASLNRAVYDQIAEYLDRHPVIED